MGGDALQEICDRPTCELWCGTAGLLHYLLPNAHLAARANCTITDALSTQQRSLFKKHCF